MDAQTIGIALISLVAGFVLGRRTGDRGTSTVVYETRGRENRNLPAAGDVDPRIIELINSDKKIHAIKLHRDLYGSGLKEAKDAIDRLADGRWVALCTSVIPSKARIYPGMPSWIPRALRSE